MTETPIPTNAPAPPSADQLSAMSELTTRMAGLTNNQHEERGRLMEAVHAEIGRGGSGWDALNGNPAKLVAEAEARALADQSGNAAPAGSTPATEYSSLRPEAFGDQDERQAFGEAMSSAGLDVRVVQSLVPDIAGDPRVAAAIRGGEAGIDARLREVRGFFERQPGGMETLRTAVAFGESLVAKDARLRASFEAAMMSENAMHALAGEARRLGFTAKRRS